MKINVFKLNCLVYAGLNIYFNNVSFLHANTDTYLLFSKLKQPVFMGF